MKFGDHRGKFGDRRGKFGATEDKFGDCHSSKLLEESIEEQGKQQLLSLLPVEVVMVVRC
jgi:hypothetical protein